MDVVLQGIKKDEDGHLLAEPHRCDISKKQLIKSLQDLKKTPKFLDSTYFDH